MSTTEDTAWILRNPFGNFEPNQEPFGGFGGQGELFLQRYTDFTVNKHLV